MLGNSLKSDVLPIVKLGAQAVHIPFHTTWVHEMVSKEEQESNNYLTLDKIEDILSYLK